MRWTDHDHPLDHSPIQHFPGDQSRFDRLPHAHIVGDQKTDRFKLQGHEKRNDLISTRFEPKVADTPEWTSSGAELEPQGIPKKKTRFLIARPLRVGRRKSGRTNGLLFERKIDQGSILVGASQRPEPNRVGPAIGKNSPFPSPGLNK